MSNGKNSLKQDNSIQNIINQRQYAEKEVFRILKKSPSIKINPEKVRQILDFLFLNLPDIIESLNKDIDYEQIEILESKSKNDLKLAKIAYDIKDYGNALFHLQQSVEKTVKAYGLLLGIINNPKDEIGHKTPKVYLKMLRFSWINDISNIFTPNINIQKNISKLDSLVQKDKNSLELDKSIPFFLDWYEATFKQAVKGFSKKEVKTIINEVKHRCGIDIQKIYMTQLEFGFLLYLFSFVTWIYAIKPRYEGEYNQLNIIRYFNKIVKFLDETCA